MKASIGFKKCLRGWGGALALGALQLPLAAQAFQSQFSEVKLDRSKAPGTWHGGVEVESASGALSLNIPLGPGIGDRGLKYVPTLRGHWAPQIGMAAQAKTITGSGSTDYADFTFWPKTLFDGGFTLTPGYFRLVSKDYSRTGEPMPMTKVQADAEVPTSPVETLSNFTLPDGSAGSVMMMVPALDEPGAKLTKEDVQELISKFGFDRTWSIASGMNTATASQSLVRYGQNGEIIIGLNHPDLAPSKTVNPIEPPQYLTDPNTGLPLLDPNTGQKVLAIPPLVVPGVVLVIKDNIATRFNYLVDFRRGIERPTSGSDSAPKGPILVRQHLRYHGYALASVKNRGGDEIVFDGCNAKWRVDGKDTGVEVSVGAETDTGWAVNYSLPGGQAPTFTFTSLGLNEVDAWDGASREEEFVGLGGMDNYKIDRITNSSTGEQISVTYDQVGEISQGAVAVILNKVHAPTLVNFPGRSVEISWDSPRPYLRTGTLFMDILNMLALCPSDAYRAGMRILPTWFSGVASVTETDVNAAVPASSMRKTIHARTIPMPDWNTPGNWTSTQFHVLQTKPDGKCTLIRYAPPFNGMAALKFWNDEVAIVPDEARMKALAFLKHVDVEAREFENSQVAAADFAADGSILPIEQSHAYQITVKDRWDLRSQTNPDGYLSRTAVPFPTRSRVWSRLDGTLKTVEYTAWDALHRGWQRIHQLVDEAKTIPPMTCETMSLGLQGQEALQLADVPSKGTYEFQAKTFDADLPHWIFGREVFEQTTILVDNTPNRVGSLPFSLPPTTKAFDSKGLNRLEKVTQGLDALNLKTEFFFKGDSGIQAMQLDRAKLTGVGHSGPTSMGASYGYDAVFGRVNEIKPDGVSWSLKQSQDAFGSVTSQTDANGITTSYEWDGGLRLKAIRPPDPEVSTFISPDPDNLGFSIQQGKRLSRLRFNAFGESILEQRSNDGAVYTSAKAVGRDKAGRSTWESVWSTGAGDERQWANVTPQGKGSTITYDPFGRPTFQVDPNGVTTQTSYGQGTKTVTLGQGGEASTTTFSTDVKGRLIKVVDALQQVTTYHYDPAGRIAEVHQFGDNGVVQVRKWSYDGLGRLTSLSQPESGTTTYEAFTLQGKPTITRYLGDGNSPARVITTTFDGLGRLTQVQDENNTTLHHLKYGEDEIGHGAANGKVVRATTGSNIERVLNYGGLNGRLNSQSLAIPGVSTPLTWSIDYTNDGQLKSRTYPNGDQLGVAYDEFKSMPKGADWNGTALTTLQYNPTHWGLENITWSGTNAFSTFAYDPDQIRLSLMAHTIPSTGGTPRAWNYKYDSQGRLTTDGEDSYTYDALGRLSQAFVRDFSPGSKTTMGSTVGLRQSFAYDPFGNRKSLESLSVSGWAWGAAPSIALPTTSALLSEARQLLNYSLNADQISQVASTNHLPSYMGGSPTGATYDGQGNLLSLKTAPTDDAPTITMTYDALGRVVTLKNSVRNIDEKYYYDDQGLRCVTESYVGGELKSKKVHVYNEARQMIAEYVLGLE